MCQETELSLVKLRFDEGIHHTNRAAAMMELLTSLLSDLAARSATTREGDARRLITLVDEMEELKYEEVRVLIAALR